MRPDPKSEPRIVDPAATRRVLQRHRECAACGEPAATGHHIVPKGERGDDVAGNIVPLCGHGTAGCHGAFHGNPYVVGAGTPERGERRDSEWVRRAIGFHLNDERPDVIQYVIAKLGDVAGRDYLRRIYYLEVM